jgi:hypothetical protein
MAFGQWLKEEGWTVVTLSADKALEFYFLDQNEITEWLNEAVADDDWQRISFRTLAFRDLGTAVLFKLSCC